MIVIINSDKGAPAGIYDGMEQTAVKRNTRQKTAVERIVAGSCDHPTAETVCDRVRLELPSVSLGTVYRILKGLAADGKIREIAVPNAPSRFDKTTRCHAHFVCTECGAVEDLDAGERAFVRDAAERHPSVEIQEAEIIFKGLCPLCKERKL